MLCASNVRLMPGGPAYPHREPSSLFKTCRVIMAAMFADRAGKTRLIYILFLPTFFGRCRPDHSALRPIMKIRHLPSLPPVIRASLSRLNSMGGCLKSGPLIPWHNRSVNQKSSGFDYSSISKISSRRPEKKSATRLNSSSSAISSKY